MFGAYFVMPESPKYLITKKSYDQARSAINYIARMNGSKVTFNGSFDREVMDRRSFLALNQSTFLKNTEMESRLGEMQNDVDVLLRTPKPVIREEQ